MGVILLTLFSAITTASFQARFGLALFSGVFFALGNQAELASLFGSRGVMHRQMRAGQYGPWAYGSALVLVQAPVQGQKQKQKQKEAHEHTHSGNRCRASRCLVWRSDRS